MPSLIESNNALAPVPAISRPSPVVPEWFAIYTNPRHEKKVAEQLSQRNLESFLPLYFSVRRWKNGCKTKVALPLFPGYLFVRISREQRIRVLEMSGVLWFVGIGGKPTPLLDSEIDALRAGVQAFNCEPHPYLVVGEKARIKKGPLEGFEGVLVRKKGGLRVVISLELIMKSIAIEVDATEVEPVGSQVVCPITA